MSDYHAIENALADFELKSSLRGLVLLVEELDNPSKSFVRVEFDEQRASPQEVYSPLEKRVTRDFPLQVAEEAGVAFSGLHVQFDVYTKGPYTVSVLRKHEIDAGDDSWKDEFKDLIDAIKSDDE